MEEGNIPREPGDESHEAQCSEEIQQVPFIKLMNILWVYCKPKTLSDSQPPPESDTPSVVFTHINDDGRAKLDSLNTSRASWSSTSSNEPVCRICHDTEDERGKTKLISPCGCSGSAQFIHKKCLQKWTSMKGATTCEICNQRYKPKYIRLKQRLMTRQVMCMGSAASLPLLVVIIVGFFLLGEQLNLGSYDDNDESSPSDKTDESEETNASKLMVSVCMIATATFGIFLLCCFSIWAARVQPHQLEFRGGSFFGQNDQDVENGTGHHHNSRRRIPAPLYFF
nr:E3 ubiquitin-protein ligase MARCHF11-like [Lytechinus pictus]